MLTTFCHVKKLGEQHFPLHQSAADRRSWFPAVRTTPLPSGRKLELPLHLPWDSRNMASSWQINLNLAFGVANFQISSSEPNLEIFQVVAPAMHRRLFWPNGRDLRGPPCPHPIAGPGFGVLQRKCSEMMVSEEDLQTWVLPCQNFGLAAPLSGHR